MQVVRDLDRKYYNKEMQSQLGDKFIVRMSDKDEECKFTIIKSSVTKKYAFSFLRADNDSDLMCGSGITVDKTNKILMLWMYVLISREDMSSRISHLETQEFDGSIKRNYNTIKFYEVFKDLFFEIYGENLYCSQRSLIELLKPKKLGRMNKRSEFVHNIIFEDEC